MIAGAIKNGAEWAVDPQPSKRRDELFCVSCPGFGDAGSKRPRSHVANHGAEPRIVVKAPLIGRQKRLVLGGRDRIPRITRYQPAHRRFVLQRVEVLRLAREQACHEAILENASDVTLTHEFCEVRTEQYIENAV